MRRVPVLLFFCIASAGCEAQVVIPTGTETETETETETDTTGTNTAGTGTSTGGAACPCADNEVCSYASDPPECLLACMPEAPNCPSGFECDACATGSCPGCKNCVSACVPQNTPTPSCTSHDQCLTNQLCVFSIGECRPECTPFGGVPCPAGMTCNECATGSCPGCDDCVAACTN